MGRYYWCLSQHLKGNSDSVASVCMSIDGSRVVSGSRDKTVKIWDATTGACLNTLEGRSGCCCFVCLQYYLNGTVNLGLVLGASADGKIRLLAYADSSFAIYPDAKGQGGMFISYGCGSILSRTTKLPVAASTAETELYQLSNTVSSASRELEFAKYPQYMPENEPGVLFEDNSMSAIHMANKGKSISHRTRRHIKVKYYFVKEYLDNGDFILVHCRSTKVCHDDTAMPPLLPSYDVLLYNIYIYTTMYVEVYTYIALSKQNKLSHSDMRYKLLLLLLLVSVFY